MKKLLLILTFFVLANFVNGQDKIGFGNDTEGCDSAGIGPVTTWVKPIVFADTCCECVEEALYYNSTSPFTRLTTLALAKNALDRYRNHSTNLSGMTYRIINDTPLLNNPIYKYQPCVIVTSINLPQDYYYIMNPSYEIGMSIIFHLNAITKYIDYIEEY
jgi:hypothetical protein